MNKHQVTILILALLFAISQICFAADNTVTIIAEGTYIMGDGETASAAELRAFENAKRSAIEQAGVYVESYSQTKNLQLSKDEVNVISSGLVQATVIDKKRTIEGETGFRFWCKAKCVVKLDSVADMKARLSDRRLIYQYNDLQANNTKIQKELADLKLQLQNATTDAAKKIAEVKIAQNEHQVSIQNMLERAYQLGVTGDYDTEILICTQILTKDDSAEAYYYRANAYGAKEQYELAIADYNRAIVLIPEFTNAYSGRGIVYAKKSELDLAIVDFNKAIQLKPYGALEYFNRGLAYEHKGEYDHAITDYNQAINLKPDYADAYNCRANAYGGNKQYDKAIADYSQAIVLKSDLANAYYNRGNAYGNIGQYDKAIADFTIAINLEPDYYKYYNRGNTYGDEKQYDKAIADYSQAIKLRPDLPNAYYWRGYIFIAVGQIDQAISDFSQVIKLKPDDFDAYYYRGKAYVLNKQPDQAITDFSQVIKLEPDDFEAYYYRGKAYVLKKQPDQAIMDLSQAIRLKPTYALAYNLRGIVYYYMKGNTNKAIADWRMVRQLDYNYFMTLDQSVRDRC